MLIRGLCLLSFLDSRIDLNWTTCEIVAQLPDEEQKKLVCSEHLQFQIITNPKIYVNISYVIYVIVYCNIYIHTLTTDICVHIYVYVYK